MTTPNRGPVRLGIAGAGAISQLVHLPILVERRDVDVIALTDSDEMKARTIGDRLGVKEILTNDQLVQDERVEGIVICTPTFHHQGLAVAALEAGKHVLIERPAAMDAEEVRRIQAAAEKAGKEVMVGMAHRYRADVAALRAFIAGGELGTVTAIRGTWLNRKIPKVRTTWRQRPTEAGGGALMDLGTQALDLTLWLLGYPEIARVSASTYGMEFGVETEAHIMAVTRDGATMTLAASWSFLGAEDVHQVRIMGVEGDATLSPLSVHRQVGGRPMDVTPRQPLPRGGEDLFTNSYRRLLDHFVRVVGGRAEAGEFGEQAILMGLIQAAYQSAREGREITLD